MKKRTGALWIATIFIVSVIMFGVPFLVKQQLSKSLSMVLGQSTTINQLKINLFTGNASIEGLKIGDATQLNNVAINIQILPLMSQHLHIQSLFISDLFLPIQEDANGISVADYLLPRSKNKASDEESEPWRISFDDITLQQVTLDANYHGSMHQLVINKFFLGAFDTNRELETPLNIELTVDNAPVKLSGTAVVGKDTQKFSGSIKIDGFELSQFAGITDGLKGRLNLNQQFKLNRTSEDITADADGTLKLNHFDGFEATIDDLSWKGALNYSVGNLSLDGDFSALASNYLAYSAASLSHSGLVKIGLSEPSIKLDGEFSAEAISASPYGKVEGATWNGVISGQSTTQFLIKGDLALENIQALASGNLERVSLDGIDLNPQKLHLESAIVANARLKFERNESGDFAALSSLQEEEDSLPAEGSL
ncbi:MAG: hypothetical protein ACI9FB_001648, partial [Candidatus Azotimanducaceae bacterium]